MKKFYYAFFKILVLNIFYSPLAAANDTFSCSFSTDTKEIDLVIFKKIDKNFFIEIKQNKDLSLLEKIDQEIKKQYEEIKKQLNNDSGNQDQRYVLQKETDTFIHIARYRNNNFQTVFISKENQKSSMLSYENKVFISREGKCIFL